MASYNGGNGPDIYTGTPDNDVINGNGGNDTLNGSGGDDKISGGDGNDLISGDAGNDQINGNAGNDTLNGGDGDDVIRTDSADIVDGGAGNDLVAFDESYVGSGSFSGGAGNDTLQFFVASFDGASGGATFNGFEYIADNSKLTGTANADTVNLSSITSLLADANNFVIHGGGGNDTITGGIESDHIYGDAGNDTLNGGGGDDVIFADGADIIDGGAGNDGVAFDESYVGGGIFNGGAGTDTLEFFIASFDGASGSATFNGFEYIADNGKLTGTANADTINLSSITSLLADANNFVIHGGGGNDSITGGIESDHIYGDAGSDILKGGGGNDVIYAEGADTIDGGAGDDLVVFDESYVGGGTFSGGAGTDTLQFFIASFDGLSGSATFNGFDYIADNGKLTGTANADMINLSSITSLLADANNFVIHGGGGNDSITGGIESDHIYGDAGNDTLNGGGGNDVIYADGADTIDGGAGDDLVVFDESYVGGGAFSGGAGADTLQFFIASFDAASGSATFNGFDYIADNSKLTGTINADTINLSSITSLLVDANNFVIHGGGGDDTLTGGIESDHLYGDAGNDVLNGGGGNDQMLGGDGDDRYIVSDAGDQVVESGNQGNDSIATSLAAYALTANVENLSYTGAGAFSGTGNDLANLISSGTTAGNVILNGGGGNDTLVSGAGNDSLDGGAGADNLYGGTGNDSYAVDSAGDVVFENAGAGTDTVTTSANYYLYANVENLTLAAGAGNIFGVGNELANTITGNEGGNTLLAGAGNDVVHGGAGVDILYGEDGADQLFGDADNDVIVAGAGNDVIDGGTGGDLLYGEDGNDTIWGGTDFVFDQLVGGAGDDVLHGDSGLGDFDYLIGNTGNDSYYVDTYADLTFENAGEGTDTVYASTAAGSGYYLYANVENLVLTGNTFYGVGNELANVMTGSALDNWLLGGAGNDILNGKGGNDVLFGQDGADTFVFEHGTGADTIADFTAESDRIDLSAFGFTSFAQVQAAMSENGGSTAIVLGGGDLIVLQNVANAALHSGDFILSASAADQPIGDIETDYAITRFGLAHQDLHAFM